MGLGDKERINGIYRNLDHLTQLASALDDDCNEAYFNQRIKRLKQICSSSNVWHTFLGSMSNGAHWIFGSESGNVVTGDSTGPWGVAIMGHMYEWRQSMGDDQCLQRDYSFNAFDSFLSMEGLIGHHSPTLGKVFEIFATTESLVYYFRRYKDGMVRSHQALDGLLSEIMGLCFGIFDNDKIFAVAYLVHEITKIVYGDTMYALFPEDQDWVTKWAQGTCMHHNMSRMLSSSEHDTDAFLNIAGRTHAMLTSLWIDADRKHTQIAFARVCAAVILAGRRFHYEHQHANLIELCSENGLTDEQIGVLKGYLRHCIKQHERKSADDRECYSKGDVELSVHRDI